MAIPFALTFAGVAAASDLYTTMTITSGTAPERRDIGFANCLRDVVVRVTGDQRLASTSRVEQEARRAGELIASYQFRDRMSGTPIHDEQGSYDRPHDLTCVFDTTKLDAFLREAGRAPWPNRPRIVAVIGIHDMKGRDGLLASDSSGARDKDMRASLMASADRLALTLILPAQAEFERRGASPKMFSDERVLDGLADAAGGDVVLAGRIVWSDHPPGWTAEWHLSGRDERWGTKGVGFDDAFRNALSGAAQLLSGNGAP
ncbi:DUF2066 domain-containing protein [Aminobacter sp. HY435]|uniref:DUF2066 domain-containing protein n=1 Tax=Aminobacter sp. HY435 TaxID=2970917 RepID=UPI0022B975BB|nr:DUF2066 domain-containing protein [Aminobacter sp. HY435]